MLSIIIIIIIIIKTKKFQKSFQKMLRFSKIFFYQFFIISGCIFTMQNTNSVLKYPVFSEIFQKKLFSCIRPNSKFFLSTFFKKKKTNKQKLHLSHVLKIKNGYHNQFMIIH